MTTFFAIVGFITVIIIIVNLTNSYNSHSKTSVNSNQFPAPNRAVKENSLFKLTLENNCTVDRLEETIIYNLYLDKLNEIEIYQLMNKIKNSKIEEAKILNINPEDTKFAIIEHFIYKYLQSF
jgi:hypothetical protein